MSRDSKPMAKNSRSTRNSVQKMSESGRKAQESQIAKNIKKMQKEAERSNTPQSS